jgi:hypothetical protein
MKRIFQHRSAAHPPANRPDSFRAYMVIHKIHLMNLKNAATLLPDAARYKGTSVPFS